MEILIISVLAILGIIDITVSIYLYHTKTRYIKTLEAEIDSLKRAYSRALEVNENYSKLVEKYLENSLNMLDKKISNIVEKR